MAGWLDRWADEFHKSKGANPNAGEAVFRREDAPGMGNSDC